MLENNIGTLAVYAPIKGVDISLPIHPIERQLEIMGCKNERVKIEKYLVWKLLEKVVKDCLNLDFDNLQFTKTDNGQWICPGFYFSLSHTDALVCVVVSDAPVGVDAEILKAPRRELADRILTARERMHFDSLKDEEQGEYFVESWVKKESIFKMTGAKALLPNRIETDGHRTVLRRVDIGGHTYLISVCSEADTEIEFKFMEEI